MTGILERYRRQRSPETSSHAVGTNPCDAPQQRRGFIRPAPQQMRNPDALRDGGFIKTRSRSFEPIAEPAAAFGVDQACHQPVQRAAGSFWTLV